MTRVAYTDWQQFCDDDAEDERKTEQLEEFRGVTPTDTEVGTARPTSSSTRDRLTPHPEPPAASGAGDHLAALEVAVRDIGDVLDPRLRLEGLVWMDHVRRYMA